MSLFLGGANSIQFAGGNRLCCELNHYIAEMWQGLIGGWKPDFIDKSDYMAIKVNPELFDPRLVGWVGVSCSYSGKWFGGFAGKVETKGGLRDYQAEAHKNTGKQLDGLKGVIVKSCGYDELDIPNNSIVYCDPPYDNTTKYKDSFNHSDFWCWCRDKAEQGHKVFISEYNAPDDFVCVWEQEVKSSLSANGKSGKNKVSVERLFVHKSQVESDYESLY